MKRLQIITGYLCGNMMVEVDTVQYEKISFDGYYSWHRINNFFIDCDPGIHHVKIYPRLVSLEEKLEILQEKRKIFLQEDPGQFKHSFFIFDNIMVNGKITK